MDENIGKYHWVFWGGARCLEQDWKSIAQGGKMYESDKNRIKDFCSIYHHREN